MTDGLNMRKDELTKRSRDFSVRVVKFCDFFCMRERSRVLADQILRSGTSIGANIREAQNASSKRDFIQKMSIALREANETQYWLEILHGAGKLSDAHFSSLYGDCTVLAKMLSATVKTAKKNLNGQ